MSNYLFFFLNPSSSSLAAGTDSPDSLSPFVPIIHRFRQVFETTSCVHTELLFVSSCWLARPCAGIHWRTSLISSSLLLQQCPTYLVRLILVVLEIECRWSYSYCFVEFCFQDLFNIARSILVQFLSSFFSTHFVSVHVMHPYSRIGTTAAWMN